MIEPTRSLRAARVALAAVLLALCAAGCTTNGTPILLTSVPHGTVAFESIEGLPEGQFRTLVQSLTQEAEARQIAVVSRNEAAQYRIRGYAAAAIHGKRTTVAWVWDVYDAEHQRAVRISGEEQASPGRRGWAAADDPMLQRMAREGMSQLAGFLANPEGAPPPPAAPGESGPAIAAIAVPAGESATPAPMRTSALAMHGGFSDASRH